MDLMQIRRMLLEISAGGGIVGADFIKGSFTVPDDANSFTLNFGKTFSKYLFIIEADDDSKDAIVATGYTSTKAYVFMGVYPDREINNTTETNGTQCMRIAPSTGVLSRSGISITLTDSSITIGASAVSAGNASYLYRGMTYNYFVVEIP